MSLLATIGESSPSIVEGNDSIDQISKKMKALVKKIQDLRHLGIENHKLPLPKICVVGDQSTGKSSLIEGMSEIKVPRSAGCCTRCPLEINLSDSDQPDSPWTCKIFLMKKYIYSSHLTKRGGKGKGLGPWIDQDPESIPFITVTDKADVQEALKWAQLATLNPSSSFEDYIPGQNLGTSEATQVKFSPNVVRLDISAPHFPNLSFYDLPGVINVAEVDDEKYLVTLVENLVKQYISTSSCTVLLTLPMTDDATNSSAARIIREVKATSRTLGVLTKPDRIGYGEGYEQWKEILRGEKFAVGHSYYVIRNNPNPQVEHAQAREEEEDFFSTGPWRNELSEHSDRFGTRKLQMALSRLLKQQIEHSLPEIISQIQIRALQVENELMNLPDPPTDGIQFVLSELLTEFNDAIRSRTTSSSDGSDYPLQKLWMKIAGDFQRSLLITRPTMKTGALVEKFLPRKPDHRMSISLDDDLEITETRPSPNKRKAGTIEPESTVKRQVMRTPPPSSVSSGPKASRNPYVTEHFSGFTGPVKVFTLEEIREISTDTYASGVPGLVNPFAVETMNKRSVMHWDQPMEEFLAATYDLMQCFLLEKLDQIFSTYQRTALYGKLMDIILSFLRRLKHEHMLFTTESYQVERTKPFTLAKATFQRAQKEAHDVLKAKRQQCRVARFLEERGDTINGKKDITDAEMGEDEFSREIEIMAASRAYYDIASCRFVDTLCQSVHTKLFLKCDSELRSAIIEELGIKGDNASERCLELMVEDPERQMRRRELKREQEKLRKAMDSLKTVEDADVTDSMMLDTA
ncbi:hypothetical protein AJ79_03733 [Helicocarpus griseus UAMH5409]|uniref:GED domain-containing protein n=1 Tax=Helicocarpus griseus UAMH5409 TaxID=1447875 RepID=A0A2B7XXV8_9EURO|nr:hypothetical protein AJ79_03733 [Helicocarpus griseus UAMH5409]